LSARVLAAALAAGGIVAPVTGAAAVSAQRPQQASQPGSITVRLLDASAARKNDPRARIYIDDNVKPGATILRHIDVSNSSTKSIGLHFYADSAHIDDGGFIATPGRGINELTGWTTVTPAAQTIPARGHVVLTVTITVPRDVQSGERYGVILADIPPAAPTKPNQIAVGARVGIRVYLSVSRGAEPITNFRIDSLTALRSNNGQPLVHALVHNVGGRAVDLSGTLSLDHGPGGLRAGPYPVVLGTTLGPGQTAPVSVPLDRRLPAGPWHATLTLTSGTVTRAAEATLVFPTLAGTSGPAVPAKAVPITERRSVVVPVAGGLLGLLSLAFLLLLLLLRRRRNNSDDDPPTPTNASPPGALSASSHT
jgi:hypothetical protein